MSSRSTPPNDAREGILGRWPIVSVAIGDATDAVLEETDPSVTFADDGTLTLVTGCNNGRGAWALENGRLRVGPLAQTRMFCSEPEGVMEQEAALTRALESAGRFEVTPRKLTILDEKGLIVLIAIR